MIQIFTNVNTRNHYDINGNLFPSGMPQIFFRNKEQVRWQLCSETTDIADNSRDATSWAKYTGYASLQGVGAYLTADDNFIKRIKGALSADVSAGSVLTITATFEDISKKLVCTTGTIGLVDDDGNAEMLEYESRTVDEDTNSVTFTFPAGTTVAGNYETGGEMNVNESVLMQAAVNLEESDIPNGLFVFDATADSPKLRDLLTYSNLEKVDVMGLELAVFSADVENDTIQDIDKFFMKSFAIRTGIAETNVGVSVIPVRENEVIELVRTLIANGMSMEFSADGSTNWHEAPQVGSDSYFRFKSNIPGSSWSGNVSLPAGKSIYDIWIEAGNTGDEAAFLADMKGASGDNAYVYIAWASNNAGADFSLTPSDDLPYIAIVNRTTPFAHNPAILADFTGASAIWLKWKGTDSYTYRAYASDDEGAGFSLTPSDSLPYTAVVTTNTPFANDPATLADFTGANAAWVRWKGSDGYFTKVAWASDDEGTGFSLIPSFELKYRAEIQVATDIDEPTLEDFTTNNAVWVQCIGESGLSAYELWIQEGGDGTEAEFLASLKGSDMFTYVAFATDTDGTGFIAYTDDYSLQSLTASHVYRAEIHLTTEYTGVVNYTFFTQNNAKWLRWIGENATISIGTVTTADAGTNAAVTNSGTSVNAVLNFTIPKGDKGEGLHIDVANTLDQRDEYDAADQGFVFADTEVFLDETTNEHYINTYIKNSNTQGDWSEAVRFYAGRTGRTATVAVGAVTEIDFEAETPMSVINVGNVNDAVFDFVLRRGQRGLPGEGAEPLAPMEFTVRDLVAYALNIPGTKAIASVQLYDENGKGVEIEAGDSASNGKCRILYDYEDHGGTGDTTVYFGEDLAATYNWPDSSEEPPPYIGVIVFSHGIQAKSPFQLWRDEYGDESSTTADYLAWLRTEGASYIVTSVESDNTAEIPCSNIPYALRIGNTIYPLEKGTFWKSATGYTIDFTDYIGYESETEFSGTWYVYVGSGVMGEPNTLSIGTVESGSTPSVSITGESPSQTLNFVLQKGDTGTAATIEIGTVATGEPGTNATVTNSGSSSAAVLDFSIPKGQAATVEIGTVTTGSEGTNAVVTNSGSSSAAVLNFTIPAGNTFSNSTELIESSDLIDGKIEFPDVIVPYLVETSAGNMYPLERGSFEHDTVNHVFRINPAKYLAYDNATSFTGTWKIHMAGGAQGEDGVGFIFKGTYDSLTEYAVRDGIPDAVRYSNGMWAYSSDTASTGNAPPESTSTPSNDYWTLIIADGTAATVSAGTVTTGAAGTSASVENAGTENARVLNFTIPKGDKGDAATIAVGTVTTGIAGSQASVTNVGNSGAAVFNFSIPAGETFSNSVIEFTSDDVDSGNIEIDDTIAPYLIETNQSNLYPVEKGTVTHDTANDKFIIALSTYLGYESAASVSGTWKIHMAGGTRGNDGIGYHYKGNYDSSTEYQIDASGTADVVRYGKGLWAYSNNTSGSGNAPPASTSTESNDYWHLLLADGAAATVAVGTVTTGAAGSSVSISNSGDSNAAVLNFTIPKGDTGATGTLTGAVEYDEAVAYPYLKLVSYGSPASLYQVIDESGTTAGDTPVSASAKFLLVAAHGEKGSTGGVVHIVGVWNAETTYNVTDGISDGVRGNGGVFATKQSGNLNHALPTAEEAENDWWVLVMADSQVYGANCVLSPTPPTEVYDGLIWCQQEEGDTVGNMNISPIDVVEQATEPATPSDGTVWIEEA